MKLEEYNESLKNLEILHAKSLKDLARTYALANNPYKIGDVFEDHIGKVLIESIGVTVYTIPSCTYYGLELKKDGTPRKDGNMRLAYQNNDKSKKKASNE